jgi:MscS family membrane protein
MDAFIPLVPGWDNLVFGMQFGVLMALLAIFVIGMIARQLTIYLIPHLLSRWTKNIDNVNEFELSARSPFGASAAGLVWWKMVEYLGAESAAEGAIISLPSTYEYWLTAFGETTFLVGALLGAIRLVELVEMVVLWWDKDGVLDGTEKTLISAVESVLRFIILVFGILALARAFNFDIATIITGLGVGGLAFAFAAKDTIGNLFGAVTLLLDRPFKMGDWIKVGKMEGEVIEIGIRTTLIRTSADTVVTLPNASLVNKNIENFGKRRWRRYLPVLYLDLSSDSSAVESFCRRVEDLIRKNPKTQKGDDSYAHVAAISKDSIEIGINLYWDVSGGGEEKKEREKFLLQLIGLAEELNLTFFEPRIRRTGE